MFTHVFDEMQCGFFDAYDQDTLWIVCRDREIAYESCEKAVEAMTLIVQGFTIEYVEVMTGFRIEYADIVCWDVAVVACTRYELSRAIEWANKALMYLETSKSWDEYFAKSDKLEQQTRNLWEVARALSQLRMSA